MVQHQPPRLPLRLRAGGYAEQRDQELLRPLRAQRAAAVFGIGWGLSGICPGPGLVIAASGLPKALVFVAAMIAAGQLVRMAESRLKRPPEDIGV